MPAGTQIVGRNREVSIVSAAIGELTSGPGAVVIEGEPGIGKTELLATIVESSTGSSTVLSCRPVRAEAKLSFGGLADLLDGLDDAVFDGLPEPQRRALDAVRLRREPSERDLMQRAVGTALCTALRDAAVRGPVLVVVDDVQWLDGPTAGALSFAVRRLGSSPIGVAVAVRSGPAAIDPLGIEDALGTAAVRVVVGPLSVGALHDVIAARLGLRLARPVLVRIRQVAGGNPFYALELTRALADRGQLDDPAAALSLTDRLHALVDDRIAALEPAAARACLVVAALAHPTIGTVVAATDSSSWADCGGEAAEDAGILQVVGAAVDFTHSLLGSGVHDASSPSERRAVHRRLADLVADPEERARHLAASVVGPDASAAAALDRGAEHAWRRGAREVAAELAERALELTATPDDTDVRRLVAARYQFEASNPTRARLLVRQILDGTPTRAARLEAMLLLGSLRFFLADFDESTELLETALADLRSDEASIHARLAIELAFVKVFSGDVVAGAACAEAALTAARTAAADELERSASSVLALAHFLVGKGLRVDLLERCLDGPEPTEPLAFEPMMPVATLLKWCDELERSHQLFERIYELTQSRGGVAELPIVAWQMTELELMMGRWGKAERLAEEAVEGARFRGGLALAMTLSSRAQVHALQGRFEAARADVDEAETVARSVGGLAALAVSSAAVHLAVGCDDPAAVHERAEPIVQFIRATDLLDPGVIRWLPDEIDALVALGELDPAVEMLGWFDERCRRTGRRSGIAAGHRCRAQVAALAGDHAEAAAHIDTAIAMFADIGLPFEHARSLLVAGRIHRRARRKAPAQDALASARDGFEQLGAPTWVRRAEDEAARLGVRQGSRPATGSLTEAEEQIVHLVAAGSSNREVATGLFMSPKTVESHLTRIYRKLGIRSRTELSAFVARRGSDPGARARGR